jgi:putative transcriptional regulator
LLFGIKLLKATIVAFVKLMGKIRLKLREFADEKGWTLKEVSERSGIPYATVKKYAQATLATVDYTALQKLARIFESSVDDLIEVVEE